jgi:TPR repeat protein
MTMDSIMTLDDEKIAQIWLRHALESGDADARYNVGLLYLYGQGLDVNVAEAKFWFEIAAKQGHMEASTNLGVIYAQNGDFKSAEKWFRQAVELGDEMAVRNLAVCLQQMENSK